MTPLVKFLGGWLPRWMVVPALALIYGFTLFFTLLLINVGAPDIIYLDIRGLE